MAYSKPIHLPREWAKHAKEVTSVDERMFDLDELVTLALECEICDEESVKRYTKAMRPYHFMRELYPVFPDNALCRELCKVYVYFTILLYISDDQMEVQSEEEMRHSCAGFARLEDESRKSFPEFPTVDEMRKIIIHTTTRRAVARTVMFANFVNNVASALLKHGNYPDDVVYDFRQRTSNMVSMFIQAVHAEKHPRKKSDIVEIYWRRVNAGGPMYYHLPADVFSGALGKTKQHIATITELYLYSSLCCIAMNDVFSYYYEKDTICDNMLRPILAENDNIPEAVDKMSQIGEAMMKRMYRHMQETIRQNKKNQELCSLVDFLGRCVVGWFYVHNRVLQRYIDSPFQFTLVEVDDEHITTWLSKKDEYGEKVANEFMEMVKKRLADGKMDALNGLFPIHEKISTYKDDGLYDII